VIRPVHPKKSAVTERRFHHDRRTKFEDTQIISATQINREAIEMEFLSNGMNREDGLNLIR
jgi:hypothetical protein